jgi:hypothetical protein
MAPAPRAPAPHHHLKSAAQPLAPPHFPVAATPHRTPPHPTPQIDLKDKWRNLVSAGKVLAERHDQIEAARAAGLLPRPAAGSAGGRGGGGGGVEVVEGQEGVDTDEEWGADSGGGGGGGAGD